jgi:excisionase family DNA binding protein
MLSIPEYIDIPGKQCQDLICPEKSGLGHRRERAMPSMSVKQAAQYPGVGLATTWRLIVRREVGHVKIGRRVILQQVELDRFLQKHAVPAKDEARTSRKSASA